MASDEPSLRVSIPIPVGKPISAIIAREDAILEQGERVPFFCFVRLGDFCCRVFRGAIERLRDPSVGSRPLCDYSFSPN